MCHFNSRSLARLYLRSQLTSSTKNSKILNPCFIASIFLRQFHSQTSLHQSVSDDSSRTLTKARAKELIKKLNPSERNVLLTVLNEHKSDEDKAKYEDQLASFNWRSKFGRPSKITSFGDVDPTGRYCAISEEWFLQKFAEVVPGPTTKELILVGIANAIPFIGFGFLDNFIMIVAGDQIEMILNKKFPISTMAAAALGNTVSDIIGIGSVHYVERLAQKVGFQAPKLSPIQLNLPKTKLASNVGRIIGVTIGCLIGMTPIPIFALFHGSS